MDFLRRAAAAVTGGGGGGGVGTARDPTLRGGSRLVKVVTIGDYGVGKTSFLARLVYGKFEEEPVTTLGIDFHTFEHALEGFDAHTFKFQMWDTQGQERFRSIVGSYYRSAGVVLLCFDVTSSDSWRNLQKQWFADVIRCAQWQTVEDEALSAVGPSGNEEPILPIIIVGLKADLEDQRRVSREAAEAFVEEHRESYNVMAYWECSSKDDTGFEPIKDDLARMRSGLGVGGRLTKAARPGAAVAGAGAAAGGAAAAGGGGGGEEE